VSLANSTRTIPGAATSEKPGLPRDAHRTKTSRDYKTVTHVCIAGAGAPRSKKVKVDCARRSLGSSSSRTAFLVTYTFRTCWKPLVIAGTSYWQVSARSCNPAKSSCVPGVCTSARNEGRLSSVTQSFWSTVSLICLCGLGSVSFALKVILLVYNGFISCTSMSDHKPRGWPLVMISYFIY